MGAFNGTLRDPWFYLMYYRTVRYAIDRPWSIAYSDAATCGTDASDVANLADVFFDNMNPERIRFGSLEVDD